MPAPERQNLAGLRVKATTDAAHRLSVTAKAAEPCGGLASAQNEPNLRDRDRLAALPVSFFRSGGDGPRGDKGFLSEDERRGHGGQDLVAAGAAEIFEENCSGGTPRDYYYSFLG